MLSRRDLILSGAFASRLSPEPPQRGSGQNLDTSSIESGLNEVRDALRNLRRLTPSSEVAEIRDKQRTYFKSNQKFADFVDVGLRVWERLYDWHLDNQLPLQIARTPDGRMQMQVMLTTVVLKWELTDTQIGLPY